MSRLALAAALVLFALPAFAAGPPIPAPDRVPDPGARLLIEINLGLGKFESLAFDGRAVSLEVSRDFIEHESFAAKQQDVAPVYAYYFGTAPGGLVLLIDAISGHRAGSFSMPRGLEID